MVSSIPCILATLSVFLVIAKQPIEAFPSVTVAPSAKISTVLEKVHPKRSVGFSTFGDGGGFPWTTAGSKAFSGGRFASAFDGATNDPWNPWNSQSSRFLSAHAPSPTEVANAIAAAKQASANVMIAQQQMQAAKENVLNSQRMAMDKETAAAILTQKSEAAAAIQRSEAAAAAQAVIQAQQRLAASKAAVAHQQRIAAAREAEAASALQKSAHAAAVEIQKSEHESSKFGQFARNGNAIAAHHLTLTKDTAVLPISAGNNHVNNLEAFQHEAKPWAAPPTDSGKYNGGGGAGSAYPAGAGGWL